MEHAPHNHQEMRAMPMGHEMHDKHKGHSVGMFFRKFWISLFLTMPVILYAEMTRSIFNWSPPPFPGSALIPPIFGSIVFFYGGLPFLIGAFQEIKSRLIGMMTLIAIAIGAAYIWSMFAVFTGQETLFWELTTLITIMLFGHWLEMRAVRGTQGALKELSKLLPDKAEVIRDGKIAMISIGELREGDTVLVRPGSSIPADGVISEGETDIDESMVTGESKPVEKKQGDGVIAGTVNGDGALKILVSTIGEKTYLAGVMRLVAEAQSSKSRLQMLSDKAAFYLTIVAVGGGAITFAAWLLSGAGTVFAVERLVAVLVIACPHALGLAVPLVASISTMKAAQNGFLIKQRLALEAARDVTVVLFDKTGTLTKGAFGVVNIWGANGRDLDEVLKVTASLDVLSEHPIAKAIVLKAKESKLSLQAVTKFEALRGKGVKALLGEKETYVGGPSLLESLQLNLPPELLNAVEDAGKKGQTVIFAARKQEVIGAIALADIIRTESREAIKTLKGMGIKTAMITGDSADVAQWVSKELEIDEYFAKVLPHQKSEKVIELQKRGMRIAMVGDGINDAPALTQADVGIAIGAGTNVAIESAGIILAKNDPRDIAKIIRLSQLTFSKMIQNLFWATGYNVVALPLAAGALAFKGIVLQPAVAAVFMSLSTIIVSFNALLLRRKRLK